MKKTDSSGPRNNATDFQSALQRAAALCSRQEQCSSQIRDKLQQWKVKEGDQEEIIRRLTEDNFIDDQRFATYYVKDKFRLNGWGRMKIRHMLRAKGIAESVVNQALNQFSEEDWLVACLKALKSKDAGLKEGNALKRKGKLFRFMTGRGFEPDLIYRALDSLEKD